MIDDMSKISRCFSPPLFLLLPFLFLQIIFQETYKVTDFITASSYILCPHTYVHIHILMGHSWHLSLSLLCFILASGLLPSFPLLSCYMQSAPPPISQFPPHNPFLSCPFLLCLAFSKQWKQRGETLGLSLVPIIAAK